MVAGLGSTGDGCWITENGRASDRAGITGGSEVVVDDLLRRNGGEFARDDGAVSFSSSVLKLALEKSILGSGLKPSLIDAGDRGTRSRPGCRRENGDMITVVFLYRLRTHQMPSRARKTKPATDPTIIVNFNFSFESWSTYPLLLRLSWYCFPVSQKLSR